jgi:membrane protein implicated in regulation of membrane protease activity
MMKSDYAELDAAILEALKAQPYDFWRINFLMRVLAHELAKPNAQNTREGWRLVGRRLQVLRKAGKIKTDGKKWSTV